MIRSMRQLTKSVRKRTNEITNNYQTDDVETYNCELKLFVVYAVMKGSEISIEVDWFLAVPDPGFSGPFTRL